MTWRDLCKSCGAPIASHETSCSYCLRMIDEQVVTKTLISRGRSYYGSVIETVVIERPTKDWK